MSLSKQSETTTVHEAGGPNLVRPSSKTLKQVFVGGINNRITADDLSKAFSAFGTIALVRMMTKIGGESRGFAFVRFQKVKSAEAAIKKQTMALKNLVLQIKPCMAVEESDCLKKIKEEAKIYVGGLTQKIQKDDILKYLSQFGDITEIKNVCDENTGKSKGYCFCVFKHQASVDRVLSKKEPHLIRNSRIIVAKAVHKLEDQSRKLSDSHSDCKSAKSRPKHLQNQELNHEASNLCFNISTPRGEQLVAASARVVGAGSHSLLFLSSLGRSQLCV